MGLFVKPSLRSSADGKSVHKHSRVLCTPQCEITCMFKGKSLLVSVCMGSTGGGGRDRAWCRPGDISTATRHGAYVNTLETMEAIKAFKQTHAHTHTHTKLLRRKPEDEVPSTVWTCLPISSFTSWKRTGFTVDTLQWEEVVHKQRPQNTVRCRYRRQTGCQAGPSVI